MSNTGKMILIGASIALVFFAIGFYAQKKEYDAFACQSFTQQLDLLKLFGKTDSDSMVIALKARLKELC